MNSLPVATKSLKKILIIFCLSQAALAVALVSGMPIGGSFEAREAHVADLMLRSGEWILPLRNGLIPSKPPLFHWLVALFSLPYGLVTEATARLPSILAAAILIFVTGRFAAVTCPDQRERNRIAIVASGILSLTYGFQILAINSLVDMVFAGFVIVASFHYLSQAWTNSIRSIDRWFFWSLCAGAVLAKGPLGILLPTILCVSALIPQVGVRQSLRLFFRPHLSWVLFIVLAGSWYFLATFKGGWEFVGRQLLFENVQRFSGGQNVNNEAWWFYGPSFLRSAAPWSVAFLFLVLMVFTPRTYLKWLPSWGMQFRAHVPLIGLIFSVAALGVFFSVASGKRHSYLLPMYPIVAVVIAPLVLRTWDALGIKRQRLWSTAVAVLGALICALLLAVSLNIGNCLSLAPESVQRILTEWKLEQTLSPAVVYGVLLSFFFLLGYRTVKGHIGMPQLVRASAAWWCPVALFLCITVHTYGIKNSLKHFKSSAATISSIVSPQEALAVVRTREDELFDVLLFYLRREVDIIAPRDSASICNSYSGYVLMRKALLRTLSEGGVKTVAVFSQVGDELKGFSERDIALVTCGGVSSDSGNSS